MLKVSKSHIKEMASEEAKPKGWGIYTLKNLTRFLNNFYTLFNKNLFYFIINSNFSLCAQNK